MSDIGGDFRPQIVSELQTSIAVKRKTIEQNVETIQRVIEVVLHSLRRGGKLLLFGNGGSAADSQHIAAEFVSKFSFDRRALPAIALTVDTSILTSTANDYAYERVFARQIEALGKPGDVAIGISTSGNSPNVLKAVEQAKSQDLITVGFTGANGGKLKEAVDVCLCVPSDSTARIQEVHITVAHIICGVAERELCA